MFHSEAHNRQGAFRANATPKVRQALKNATPRGLYELYTKALSGGLRACSPKQY